MLSYENLDVYKVAIQFFAFCINLIRRTPPGNGDVLDQLKRASLSILNNIAEGTGKTTLTDKRKYFSIARGSAMECGATLDALFILKLCDDKTLETGKALLIRVVSMLSRMCR